MTGGDRLASYLSAGKQPTFLQGRFCIVTRGACPPPLPQQSEQFGREHDIAILAALGLLDANDILRAVDMLGLEMNHLARPQPAAITEAKHDARLESAGHR